MKKIIALALVGFFTVAFTEKATTFDNDNENIVFTVGENDAPVDVITFEIVPVTTDFVNNVAVLTVNSTNLGGFSIDAVNTVSFDNLALNVNKFSDSTAFADVPIDYGIRSANEYEQSEPIPNLTEYVNDYNLNFGTASPYFVRTIATNVGKLTN